MIIYPSKQVNPLLLQQLIFKSISFFKGKKWVDVHVSFILWIKVIDFIHFSSFITNWNHWGKCQWTYFEAMLLYNSLNPFRLLKIKYQHMFIQLITLIHSPIHIHKLSHLACTMSIEQLNWLIARDIC